MSEHGTNTHYVHQGCRCQLCTRAHSDASANYVRALRADAHKWRALVRQIKREGSK